MINNGNFEAVFKVARTTKEQKAFLSSIELLSEIAFSSKSSIQDLIKKSIPLTHAEVIMELIQDNKIDIEDRVVFNEFLAELKKFMTSNEIVYLTLAFEPTHFTIATLFSWFKENVSGNYFLDLSVDSRIVSGCIVGYNGSIKDASLSKKLENFQSS